MLTWFDLCAVLCAGYKPRSKGPVPVGLVQFFFSVIMEYFAPGVPKCVAINGCVEGTEFPAEPHFQRACFEASAVSAKLPGFFLLFTFHMSHREQAASQWPTQPTAASHPNLSVPSDG